MKGEGLYFFHIPKTAGSSVYFFLQHSFPARDICPWALWDQLITAGRAELDEWRVFRGHFLAHLAPYLGRRLTTFTMLREPVTRTVSHYYHVRRAPEHPSYEYARRLSLAEFCVHPKTRHMVENYQANYLAKSPSDPRTAAQGLSQEDLARFSLQERMQYPDEFPTPGALLESAEARLATFEVVGITEYFCNTLAEISRKLNCPAMEVPRLNVNPDPQSAADLNNSTLALIRDLTEVDHCLYQSAERQFVRSQISTS